MADAFNFPFKDESADLVICSHFIEHIKPKRVPVFIQEIRRVLKRGGIFMLSTPNKKLRLLPLKNLEISSIKRNMIIKK
jgi:ubiquinone/menaquinone biosynthesis C-methylase UbiE